MSKASKYGTPMHCDILWAGVIKPERVSTSKFRITPAERMFNGSKAARAQGRFKRKHPITLPDKPFDFRGER